MEDKMEESGQAGDGGDHGAAGGGGGGGEAVEAIHLNTEEEVERLLSEKLVDGFLLLEKACPACVTPLVKRDAAWSPRFPMGYQPQPPPPGAASNFDSSKSYDNMTYGAGLDSVAYESEIQPIAGVPFCVSCQAHVVTNTEEVVVLESADHLKVRGTIMVAMSRETLDDGEESVLTPWVEPPNVAPIVQEANQSNGHTTADAQHVEESAESPAKQQYPSSMAVPEIEAMGSKFSTKSILKSRSDHFSTSSNGVASSSAPTSSGANADGAASLPVMMNDDEDDDISLQEIEVVHLDDHTDSSEVERRVVDASNVNSSGIGIGNRDAAAAATTTTTTTTAERIFMTRPSTEVGGPLDDNQEVEEESDMDSYHSSHYNQQVERNPLRSASKRFGGDSVANTSVAVLRSDTSVPIYATESRGASTSVAALRGDPSFPVPYRQGGITVGGGGDSPTNTSLAVLRGDLSFPVHPAASNAQASVPDFQGSDWELGATHPAPASLPTPLLRGDKMERANSEATPNVDESLSAVAVQPATADVSHTTTLGIRNVHEQTPVEIEKERSIQVDRYRSLMTHSEETPSPASFHQAARPSASIDSSPASYGPKPLPHHAGAATIPNPDDGQIIGTEQPSQRSVPVEALIKYDERRAIATRVLGKKMIQGYSLTEHKCIKCQMPLMERERVFFCVVCPVLRQHYKKTMQTKEKEQAVVQESRTTEPARPSRGSEPISPAQESEYYVSGNLSPSVGVESPPGSLAKAEKEHNLTVETVLSKASSKKNSVTKQRTPRALSESSVHNELKNDALPSAVQTSPRSEVQSKATKKSSKAETGTAGVFEPSLPGSMKEADAVENNRESSSPSRSRSKSGSHSRSQGKSALSRFEATTQTSPASKSLAGAVPLENKIPDLHEESHSSEQTSVAPDPPSNIVSDALDDESAKMSSITESYVSTFTNATSRRSIREQELKTRPSKPRLPVVKPHRPQQLEKKPEEKVRTTSSSSRPTKMPVMVETVLSESTAASRNESVRTKSLQKDVPCIEALEKYSSMISLPQQLGGFLHDVNSALLSDTDTAEGHEISQVTTKDSLRDDRRSQSWSRKSEISSVIDKQTKRLEELKNARHAHKVAENESTGMLAEFNRMLQEEIQKEESSVQHEIEVAEQHLIEVEQEDKRNAAERKAYVEAVRLAELANEAETKRKEAEDAMERSRLAIEFASALSGAGVNDSSVSTPKHAETVQANETNADIASLRNPSIEMKSMEMDLAPSPKSQEGASPRHITNLQSHFDMKRAMVTKEIGQRMMKGWNLIDASCPNCVMPLMTDLKKADEICVLCGVVGSIENETAEQSVKTWTKGERTHVGRTSSESRRASSSRRTTTSVSNVGTSTADSNRSSTNDPEERKRLKRELLREIIAETTAYMSHKKGKDARNESQSSKRSQVSAERIELILAPATEVSKKERLRELVIEETGRAAEKLSRHGRSRSRAVRGTSDLKLDSPKKAPPNKQQDEKPPQVRADPTAVHETTPVLSILFRRRDDSSRADPPASVAGSIRTKTAVDADGAASWMEPKDDSSPQNSEGDVSPADDAKRNANGNFGLSDAIVEENETDDEPSKGEGKEDVEGGPNSADGGLTLDTNVHLLEHRRVHPSPGLTEAPLPEMSSPAQSRFTATSDSTNRATYRGVDNLERMTAPVPSPGISVAPEPELVHRSRPTIDTRASAGQFPASMRPATSPGIDTIERGTLHDDDESYARIHASRSAPVRPHPMSRRHISPERRRFMEKKNRVAAIKPNYSGQEASDVPESRWDRNVSRYGEREDERSRDVYLESPPIRPQPSNLSTSSSSRPRITPESIMRPRSTRSASSLDSIDDAPYYQHIPRGSGAVSLSEERKLRLASNVRSESMSTSMGTSRAVVAGLSSPHPMNAPGRARPPIHGQPQPQSQHRSIPQSDSFSSSVRGRALLVQGELEHADTDAPGPMVVVVPAETSSVSDSDREEHDRVLSSREIIIVDDGCHGPLDLRRWQQEAEVGEEDHEDEGRSDDGGGRDGAGSVGSVGSATLDAVLARIEETKRQLESAPTVSEDGSVTIRDPAHTHQPQKLRELIDNLAAAAEEIEKQDRLDMSICF